MSTVLVPSHVRHGWVGFHHPDGLFFMAHPSDWRPIQPQGPGTVFACRVGSTTSVEIVVIAPVNDTADQVGILAGQMAKTVPSEYVNSRMVRDKRVKGLGFPAHRMTVDHRLNETLRVADYFFFEARRCVVVMIVKSSSADYANVRPIVDDIIKSVRVPVPWTPPPHPASKAALGLFIVISSAFIGALIALIVRHYIKKWDGVLSDALERELTAVVAWVVGTPLQPWIACALAGAAIGGICGAGSATYTSDDPGILGCLLIVALLVLLCVRILYFG